MFGGIPKYEGEIGRKGALREIEYRTRINNI